MEQARDAMKPQNQQKELSLYNRMVSITEQQPFCSCGRGERVIFVCIKSDCPNHKKQPLYCFICSEDEESTHEHKGKTISSLNTSVHTQWLEFRKDLGNKVVQVNKWTDQYQMLLSLLTRCCGIDTLERSINKLRELEQSVERFFGADV